MMKFLKLAGILAGLGVLAVIVMAALLPWMDRWGATEQEIAASFPGDELVPSPALFYNRAVTINAQPAEIYPWIVQLGAERGGMYSYSWFETHILQCELINADRIHEEWQGLKVGDKVKMCPGDWGPPAYEVARLEPNQAVVLGHQENGSWLDVWQFILIPQTDGTTRLVLRSRDMKTGGIWDVIRPGEFIMMRGMLLGIKERAENLAETRSVRPAPEGTPTPEVFIPLDEAVPAEEIVLEGVHLDIAEVSQNSSFPAGCAGEIPACTPAQPGNKFLLVTFKPRDLPEGQMLAYKNLPAVRVVMEGGDSVSYSIWKYDNLTLALILGFEVPENVQVFGLKWADLREIPLERSPSSTHFQTISFSEFGKNISLSYDPALSSQVATGLVSAIPSSDQILFAEAHPAYAQIRFIGFQGRTTYELPILPAENRVPQVMIFRTEDFAGFGDDSPQGFVNQREALTRLLETGINLERCAQPLNGYEESLPFLPWINMQQAFCAQPQIIEFAGGKGIRYLSYYTQGPNPVLDQQIFYTFQGLTADGKFYVSALFPIQTGIFPTDPPDCSKCSQPDYNPAAEWNNVLTEQLIQLNAQPGNDFMPSLSTLDEISQSIQIVQK